MIVDDDVLITTITAKPAIAPIVAVLREQLEAMREASARRFDAALQMQAVEDRRLLAEREDRDAPIPSPDTLERQRAIRLLDADDALAAVVRQGVERVANHLPVVEGERLMQAYERAAFPEIVGDESAGPAERYARIAASPAIEGKSCSASPTS